MTSRRLMLIGTGPLPGPGVRGTGFPTIRTAQFLKALVGAGHQVRWVSLVTKEQDGDDTPQAEVKEQRLGLSGEAFERVKVRADEPGRFLMVRDLRHDFRPDAVITAGPFLPMGAGARAAADEPLWIDVPGDPMAEAQARAARDGNELAVQRYREVYGWALARGDHFSVISERQRHAILGALGVAGRLAGASLGESMASVIAAPLPPPLGDAGPETLPDAALDLPTGARVVLVHGGFNTWLDDETMAEALLRAMDADPAIHVVVTGGALSGHDEATWPRFHRRLEGSPHRGRFRFLGWLPDERLPSVLRAAHVLFVLDRPCVEPLLGGRTRVLDAFDAGLRIVATPVAEMVEAMVGEEGFHPVPVGDPEAACRALLDAARVDARPTWTGARARQERWAELAPLLRWAAAPRRMSASVPVDFLEESWAELARLQDRLEAVWNSPTWRTLGRLHRALRRRSP